MFLSDRHPDAAKTLANPICTKPITTGDPLCSDATSKYPNAESIERQPITIENIDKAFMSFLNLTPPFAAERSEVQPSRFFGWAMQDGLVRFFFDSEH